MFLTLPLGHSDQVLLRWLQGSASVVTPVFRIIHSLLASNSPVPSWPWPYPFPTVGLIGWVPWIGLRACVLLPRGSHYATPLCPPFRSTGGGGLHGCWVTEMRLRTVNPFLPMKCSPPKHVPYSSSVSFFSRG